MYTEAQKNGPIEQGEFSPGKPAIFLVYLKKDPWLGIMPFVFRTELKARLGFDGHHQNLTWFCALFSTHPGMGCPPPV
jgi:hypothetical protein